MDLRFIIALTEHRKLGFIFVPYLVKPDQYQGNYIIYDRISLLNLSTYESALSPEEVQLIRTIEEYNDQNLSRHFSKQKKLTSRDFISGIEMDLFERHIRPFIEKRMTRCMDILQFNPVPVFHKTLQNSVYENDRIRIIEQEGSAVFNFIRSEKDLKYFLSVEHNDEELHLKGKEGIMVINDPCCVVIDKKMFVFRDIDGKKLQPFFQREYISIPKSAEKKYFDTFVRNAIKKYKVNVKGFTIIDLNDKPEANLSIECDLEGHYSYVLKFIYNETSIYYANRKTELKVTCEFRRDAVCFYRQQRDYQFENECITSLLSMGLVNREGPFFIPINRNIDEEITSYDAINWINLNNESLRKAGFTISQAKLNQHFYLDNFDLKVEVSEQNTDWFDIKASVELEGFVIPFASFSQNILDHQREYLLPDGRILILPVEWFEYYRDMLSFSKIIKDTIRLEKQHFHMLDKNIKGISGSFKNSLFNLMSTTAESETVPSGIKAELRHYQIEGYSWLYRLYKNRLGGCLADDMGLGKTIQTLTILQRAQMEFSVRKDFHAGSCSESRQLSLFNELKSMPDTPCKTSLIIVPTSLVHNWLNEANKFTPGLKIATYIGAGRKDMSGIFGKFNVILTSYGIVRNDLEHLLPFRFFFVILDESQMIKNPGSKTYQSVIQLKAEHRIVLTGTPIENSLSDMWAQMNFLNSGLLGSLSFFQQEFQLPIEKNNDEKKKAKLLKLISPFVLRRTKAQVEPELPALSEQIIFCDMDEAQEIYYEREKSKARNLVIEKISLDKFQRSSILILQSLTRLRQIANHPSLIDNNYFAGSGKYNEITRNMHSLLIEGHKTLVFSSFVKHLELVAWYLDRQKIHYAWLTGETRDRETEIKKFQKVRECNFFLISLKAGGLGLNLTAAEYILILDPWWNPAAEMQAISRAHRLGQEKHVFVYRFISRNTLEEKILKLQKRKAELADAFVNNSLKGITQEEVLELFD